MMSGKCFPIADFGNYHQFPSLTPSLEVCEHCSLSVRCFFSPDYHEGQTAANDCCTPHPLARQSHHHNETIRRFQRTPDSKDM